MKAIAILLGIFITGSPIDCAKAQEKAHQNRNYPAELIRNDYTATGVTTAAWVELDASMMTGVKKTRGDHIGMIQIFDSSGETLELGIGAAGSEARILLIEPGGNGKVPVFIPTGSRLAIKAVSADALVGEIIINTWWQER